MIISLIAAMDKKGVIGKDNSLPWKLSADLKRFKQLTINKPIIMGRKTFESIGKPLPDRTNIIITHDKNYKADGCFVAHSIESALKAAKNSKEAMFIGGAQIFKEILPRADRIYLTLIDADFGGDTYFPDFDKKEWKETFREGHEEEYKYSFVNLERIKTKK